MSSWRVHRRCLRGQASVIRIGSRGKVLAQPLRARLANMQRCTDGAYRGNAISCEFSREHHCGLLSKRIDHGRTIMRARTRPPASARHE